MVLISFIFEFYVKPESFVFVVFLDTYNYTPLVQDIHKKISRFFARVNATYPYVTAWHVFLTS